MRTILNNSVRPDKPKRGKPLIRVMLLLFKLYTTHIQIKMYIHINYNSCNNLLYAISLIQI